MTAWGRLRVRRAVDAHRHDVQQPVLHAADHGELDEARLEVSVRARARAVLRTGSERPHALRSFVRSRARTRCSGPYQYEDGGKRLMMLPTDLALVKDDSFKKYVEVYAKDQATFFADFSAAFRKLEELGTSGLVATEWA